MMKPNYPAAIQKVNYSDPVLRICSFLWKLGKAHTWNWFYYSFSLLCHFTQAEGQQHSKRTILWRLPSKRSQAA